MKRQEATTYKMNIEEKANKMDKLIKNTIEIKQRPEREYNFSYLDDAFLKKQESTRQKHLKTKIKPYTSTRIKARTFLSNIAYPAVRDEDFINNNFVFDVIAL